MSFMGKALKETPPVTMTPEEYVKSELVTEADLRQALHQEGNWYIIPRAYCFFQIGNRLNSHVFHVCRRSWELKVKSDESGHEFYARPYTSHWNTDNDMKRRCAHCDEPVPSGLIALWRFHNWGMLYA